MFNLLGTGTKCTSYILFPYDNFYKTLIIGVMFLEYINLEAGVVTLEKFYPCGLTSAFAFSHLDAVF
jgi:hypothetical protein